MKQTRLPAPPQGRDTAGIAASFNAALAEDHRGNHAQATLLYQAILRVAPSHLGALHNLGYLLLRQGERSEAERILRKTIKAHPRSAEAHNTLGLILHTTGRFREAVACYRSSIALTPDYAVAHNNLGASLHELNRPDQAIPHYQRALALQQAYPDAWRNLGNACQATGHIEEAREAYKRAIAIAPRTPSLYHGLIACTRVAPGDPYLGALRSLAAQEATLPGAERILLHFALAKALDDAGDPEQAGRHLLIANRLKRDTLRYDEAKTLGLLERIRTVTRPDALTAAAQADRSPTPIFVLGMPRSGTTLVEQILASHPSVTGGGELPALRQAIEATFGKETYPEAARAARAPQIRRVGERYLSALRGAFPQARYVVDKMPFNFLYAGLIPQAIPQARIIHVRRDAVDTCFSCFSLLFKGDLPFTYELSELGRYYRAYEGLMDHWRTVLPAGAMLEVSYEALVADLEGEARRLVGHCGLAWDAACLSFDRTERVVLTASAVQVRRPIYRSSVGRWQRYQAMLGPLFAALGRHSVGTPRGRS